MGWALFAFAGILLVRALNITAGGTALGLSGTKLGIAIAVNFVLGALMTLGIGLYAPCMILVSLLGMNPTAAFPVMMGSCAFLMPVASVRFLRSGSFDPRALLGLLVGGIPAAFIVKSLPLDKVMWLVIVVVAYTGGSMLRTAARERRAAGAAAAAAATMTG